MQAKPRIFSIKHFCVWSLTLSMVAGSAPGTAFAKGKESKLPNDEFVDANQDGKWDNDYSGDQYADSWNLKRIKADKAWKHSEGAGIRIAVISSGADLTHEDLVGRIQLDASDVNRGVDNRDRDGIGTAVAGIIAGVKGNGRGVSGVAPQATIVPYRVADHQRMIRAHERAAFTKFDVVHYSLGARKDLVVPMDAGYAFDLYFDAWICDFADLATARGKIVVVPAGNGDGFNNGEAMDISGGFTGASCDSVITVGAAPLRGKDKAPRGMVDSNSPTASFSNYGPGMIDLVAPGGNGESWDPGSAPLFEHNNLVVLRARHPQTGELVSPVRDGIAGALFADGSPKTDITESVAIDGESGGAYMYWRGSDLAAAHVTGTVALMLSAAPMLKMLPGTTKLDAVRGILHKTSTGSRNQDDYQGFGMLNADAAVKKAIKFDDCLLRRVGGATPTAADGNYCIDRVL